MKVIAFSSIKGGTGKSSLAILTANYCAATGARVLVVDLDIQNSASFFYLVKPDDGERKNIAAALQSGDLAGNIIPSNTTGVDLLASAFSLVNLRACSVRTLRNAITVKALPYDFAFIDCAPTYDNLVLNAVSAADLIITPVRFSQFDWKGARFYLDQIKADTDRASSWRTCSISTVHRGATPPTPCRISTRRNSGRPLPVQSCPWSFLRAPWYSGQSTPARASPKPRQSGSCSRRSRTWPATSAPAIA